MTVAQATQGEVVNICLEQLAHSRYFVNFLGRRYGWRPAREDLAEETFERFGYMINSYIPGRSVTECEVLCGALGWGASAACVPRHAFFYIREDAFCESVPLEEMDAYVDAEPPVQVIAS